MDRSNEIPVDNDTVGFRPLRHPSLVDAIEEQLRDHILSGKFAAGAPIRETLVASQLGVSRGPVREALRRLEQSELVVKPPNRSYVVNRLNQRDMLELVAVRTALEQLAAREAMKDPVALEAELRARVEDMRKAVENRDMLGIVRADRMFHEQLIAASGNRQLARQYSMIRDQASLSRLVSFEEAPTPRVDILANMVKWHEEILDPVSRRDVDGLMHALEKHIQDGIALTGASEVS